MAVLKCKMCGDELVFAPGATVAECESCGSKQTLPKVDDKNKRKLKAFSDANELRAKRYFDRAIGKYERIIEEFPEEAEAYWGMLLCKMGIEYVDDPATGKKKPTCNRCSYSNVLDDEDFEKAIQYASPEAKKLYISEAKELERIRKSIIEISSKEEPYDIFISFKDREDETGERTIDSVLAQDLYNLFSKEGYKVFFSRITLEGKLGEEYEPIIFSALNSSKVMILVGTSEEHFNATWVRNEWSRYLTMVQKGEKKNLILCYKDMNTDNLPKELRALQAQDLGKVGATQDLVRNVSKFFTDKGINTAYEQIAKAAVAQMAVQVSAQAGTNAEKLLERANLFLEQKNFKDANNYFDKVLDISPRDARGHWGHVLVENECSSNEELSRTIVDLSKSDNFQAAIRFANDAQKKEYLDIKACCDQNVNFVNQKMREKESRRQAYHKEFQALQQKFADQNSDIYQDFKPKVDRRNNVNTALSMMDSGAPFSLKQKLLYGAIAFIGLMTIIFGGSWVSLAIMVLIMVALAKILNKFMNVVLSWVLGVIGGVFIVALFLDGVLVYVENSRILGVPILIIGLVLFFIHAAKAGQAKALAQKQDELRNCTAEILNSESALQQKAMDELTALNQRNSEFSREWHNPIELISKAWFTQEINTLKGKPTSEATNMPNVEGMEELFDSIFKNFQ